MKEKLLNFINCPVCGKNLTLKVFEEKNKEIKEGLLLCSCSQFFPIIENIPRILIGDLRMIIYERFPDFFLKYKDFLPREKLNKEIKNDSLKKKRISESFSYEWQKFSEMLKEWEENFNFYFKPLESSDLLKDKIILDAGCGMGRYTYYSAKIAKETIAIDLSQAIDVAFYNNKDVSNVHFIQADIYNLPFRENFFDFIFSLGVLDHLPEPEEGFERLIKLLKDKAGILVYVYRSYSKNTFHFYILRFVNFFRCFTTKISFKLLYLLCYPIAILSYLIFVLPYQVFIRKTNKINWPLRSYSDYPFKVFLNDTFDRFSSPIENRYSKEEISAWYQKAGLKNVKILGGSGWRVFGIKS